jgi:hypothetical protein
MAARTSGPDASSISDSTMLSTITCASQASFSTGSCAPSGSFRTISLSHPFSRQPSPPHCDNMQRRE